MLLQVSLCHLAVVKTYCIHTSFFLNIYDTNTFRLDSKKKPNEQWRKLNAMKNPAFKVDIAEEF